MFRLRSVSGLVLLGSVVLALGTTLPRDDKERAKLARGQELMASGKNLEAVPALKEVGGDPAHSAVALEARLLEALALTLGGKPKEGGAAARALYESLPKDHAGRGRAESLIASAFEAEGRTDESARVYGRLAAEVLGEGQRARIAGHYLALAAAVENPLKSTDPLKPSPEPNPAEAAGLYAKALEILTGSKPLVAVSLPLTRALVASGQADPAIKCATALLEVKGLETADEAETRLLLARAYLASGQAARARAELERLLAMPNVAETRFAPVAQDLVGEAILAIGDGPERLKEAVAAWRRSLALYPDRKESAILKAMIAERLFMGGLADEAIPAYQALADDPKAETAARARALFGVGECQLALQRFDEAREAFRRFVAAYPDDARAPEAQGLIPRVLLQKAEAARTSKDDAGAVVAYRRFLEEFPLAAEAPTVAVEVGRILRATKKIDEAAVAWTAARDRYKSHAPEKAAEAAFFLGVVEEEDRKDLDRAALAYQDVVKNFGGTQAGALARSRVAALEAIELGVVSARVFVPGEAATVDLNVRNVKQVTFRVYRLNAREFFERRGTLDGAADVDVALVKSDRTFNFETPDYRKYRKDEIPVKLAVEEGKDLLPGAYLVAVEAEERRAVVLVLVSQIRLVVKESPYEVFCWAVDAKTGEGQPDVDILVRGPELNKKLKTGADGVARLAHDKLMGRCEVLGAFVGSVVPGLPAAPETPGQTTLAARVAFTLDRPIYRPGHEVRFQAVLRGVDKGNFVTPEKAAVQARLVDPRGRTLGVVDAVTGSFGTISGGIPLPPEGAVGDHVLSVQFAGQTFSEKVVVQEYRKPEYEVAVKPRSAVIRPGEEASFDIGVSYFFGGPLKQGAFEWRVWRAPHQVDTTRYLSHAWYLRATEPSKKDAPEAGMVPVASGAGSLDAKGKTTIGFRTVVEAVPVRYVVQVFVQDTTGQWVGGVGSLAVGPSDRFAVVLSERKTFRAGDTAEVRVVTADLAYRAASTTGRLQALRQRKDATGRIVLDPETEAQVDTGREGEARVRIELKKAGDYVLRFEGQDAWKNPVVAEARVVVTGERPDLAKEVQLRFEQEVYKGGERAKMHLSVPEAGRSVLLTFEGEKVLSYRILKASMASGVYAIEIPEELAPNVVVAAALPFKEKLLTSEDRIVVLRYLEVGIAPEKARALPGEKIKLGVTARDQAGRPVAAAFALRAVDQALADLGGSAAEDPRFVFNRDIRPHLVRTGSSFSFRFEGKTASLDPDLLALLDESRRQTAQEGLRSEVLMLKQLASTQAAPELEKSLEVRKADVEHAKNGADSIGTGYGAGGGRRAGAARGGLANKPAGAARPATKSADAKAPPLAPAEWKDGAEDEVLEDLQAGEPGQSERYRYADKSALRKSKAGYLAGFDIDKEQTWGHSDGYIEPAVREDFREVAGWWPELTTGDDGTTSVVLDVPDNLTTWAILGSGATKGLCVGQGHAMVRVSKDLILRVERPRFLGSKDEIVLPAVVHSNIDEASSVKLELRSTDPAILAGEGMSEHALDLDGLAVARRDFLVRAKAGGTAKLEAKALGTKASDALTTSLAVLSFGEPWSQVQVFEVVDRGGAAVLVPENLVTGSENFRLLIQAGIGSELLDGLAYLAAYPHACLEQSVNRFVPAMLLKAAFDAAGRPTRIDTVKLREEVVRGMTQLLGFQNLDGGFGYWPKSASDPFATALALEAMARARELGYPLPPDFLATATNGARALAQKGGVEADARAALLLSLIRAGEGNDALLNALVREKASLSVAGLSRLLIAAHGAGRSALISGLFDDLKSRRRAGDALPFTGRGAATWHGSDLEASALALLAFEKAGAGPGETAPLVKAVRAALPKRDGATKGVAVAIEALAAHLRAELEIEGSGDVKVLVDGVEVAHGRLAPGSAVLALDLPKAKLPAGRHRIEVTKDGGVSARCRAVFHGILAKDDVAAGGNVLAVERRVTAFQNPDQASEAFRPGFSIVKPESRPKAEPAPSLADAVVGSKVTIELKVKAREDVAFLAVEEPLLAGLEVIENGVRGGHERFERRDSKVVFYKNRLRKGEELTITYPCFVVFSGHFRANPATATEMYAPERHGWSPSLGLKTVPDVALLAKSAPRTPTPDEGYARGLEAFAKERFEDAVRELEEVVKIPDLLDDPHDRMLESLFVSNLRLERWTAAVKAREALETRNPGKAKLSRSDVERLGRAYLAVGDPSAARTHFQSVVLGAFEQDVQVAEVFRAQGAPARAIVQLEESLWRYASLGNVVEQERVLCDWLLAQDDPLLAEKARHLTPLERSRWKEALAHWLSLMAWHPKSPVAEDAGFRRVDLLKKLGAAEALLEECGRYLGRHGDGSRADDILQVRAETAFRLDRYDDAAADARKVHESVWPRANSRDKGPSEFQDQAAYLLGKVAHVKGDYAAAVNWYGKVRERVQDAQQSWAFFTSKELKIESLIRAAPDAEIRIGFESKNLDSVKVQVYPVDLSVLFAVKKSFDRLSTAELSGIAPAEERELKQLGAPFVPAKIEATLGTMKKGAYLVVLRSEDRTASTLLVVTKTTLRLQRDAGAVRVYLVDGDGKPVPGARVKLGINGRIFHSGTTDERGLLSVQDPGSGMITVVAEKGDDVGVASHP